MAVMGFSTDPGPLPFWTVREHDKWAPRLANGQIEIVGENGVKLPQQMVRVDAIQPIDFHQARASGLYVPGEYHGKSLIAVRLSAINGAT